MSLIAQLEYKNKALIIVLKETPCTTADKLVIPKFSLAGSVLSRNTFHVCSRAAAYRGGQGKYLPPGVALWGRRIEVGMFRTNLHYDANNC